MNTQFTRPSFLFSASRLCHLQGHGREVVAVKCIERRRLTKVSMENLITEIKVMMDLDHQHIVKLKDFEVRLPM